MQAEDVGLGEGLLECNATRARGGALAFGDEYAQIEGAGPFRDRSAQRAIAHDSERFAPQFVNRIIQQGKGLASAPGPRPHGIAVVGETGVQCQEQHMKKIWLENYPEGVPHKIDLSRYGSLVALMEESFERYPERPAFSNDMLYGRAG